jgi:hypothetical protein
MNFATQEFSANGTAALALVVALLDYFQKDGMIRPKDKVDIIAAAAAIAPQGAGRTDKEARAILSGLLDG